MVGVMVLPVTSCEAERSFSEAERTFSETERSFSEPERSFRTLRRYKDAFALNDDTRKTFWTRSHERTFAYLIYAFSRRSQIKISSKKL